VGRLEGKNLLSTTRKEKEGGGILSLGVRARHLQREAQSLLIRAGAREKASLKKLGEGSSDTELERPTSARKGVGGHLYLAACRH